MPGRRIVADLAAAVIEKLPTIAPVRSTPRSTEPSAGVEARKVPVLGPTRGRSAAMATRDRALRRSARDLDRPRGGNGAGR